MKNMEPQQYAKRILVAVSGLSPAILTETLYALAVQQHPAFVPTEIHLITTLEGKERAENTLLKTETGAFKLLCKDYDLKGIQFDINNIHVIEDEESNKLRDIRHPKDNERAADFIVSKLKELTSDENSSVHVSIAGGRKTMGYYVGYALSLFGRPQDRLSHVLVDADYETCNEFYYPTKEAKIANNRDHKPVDLSLAKVYLAEIPFVRLREYLPKKSVEEHRLISCHTSFSHTVKMVELLKRKRSLIIDVERRVLVVNGYECDWKASDSALAFYIWTLQEQFDFEKDLICPVGNEANVEYAESYLEIYEQIAGSKREINSTRAALKNGMRKSFFNDKINLIRAELRDMLGVSLAEKFEIAIKIRHFGTVCH